MKSARAAAPLAVALLLTLLQTPAAVVSAQRTERRTTPAASATTATNATNAPAERPRLVLLISVDQFRYDYLERFGDLFAPNGLRRLLRDGASWTQANYDHVPTETAPGHATMMTGAWPAETGIVGNTWYERGDKEGLDDDLGVINNVLDKKAKLIGGGPREAASSAQNLLVSTLGDELKLASGGRAKVVGVSVKDRAAILPAGRLADGAYWFSSETGRFVSSTYYFATGEVPDWVTRFNRPKPDDEKSSPADKYFGREWQRLLCEEKVPRCEQVYEERAGPDAAPWEHFDPDKETKKTFPYPITRGSNYEVINYSPFSNDLLVQFAEQALIGEGLGADATTDVLTVSFSANDIVGHRFGPYSQEAMDMTLRVDRQIAALLDIVERRVGAGRTLVAFTADHGVAPSPEHAAEIKLPGGRVKASAIVAAVREALRARFRKGGASAPDNTADYLLPLGDRPVPFVNHSIYFNRLALARDGVSREEAERIAGDAALGVAGVARYFTRTQLMRGAVSPADPVARRALHGFHPRRSGDVYFVEEPFKYLLDGNVTAMHGAPYSYDTHVPLVIMGAGVAPGRYAQAATPADLAPTLAAILRAQPPSSAMGRVLVEALR